jgi:hypothetical protein
MHFAFVNPNVNEPPRTPNVSKSVGNIVRKVDVDLEPELKAAGVNTSVLTTKSASGFVCQSSSPVECLQQIKSTGIFGSITSQVGLQTGIKDYGIVVGAAGTLDYSWKDSAGAQHTRSSPYNVLLPLGHIHIEVECGEGGEREVIAAKPLELRLDQSNYRLPVSFQSSLPAGRTSRFTVTVNAAKSSHHDFTVMLQLADGRDISSRPISLLYYVPSWFPGP